jgi:hypothetical protein
MAPHRGYKQNGLKVLRRNIALRGLRAIDWRSAGARAATDWRAALIADLGTEENLTTAKLTLLDYATRTKLFLDHIDAFLLAEESFIYKGRRSAWPILMQRQQLVTSLERTLSTLGLERQAKKLESLPDYLARIEREKQEQPIEVAHQPDDRTTPEGDRA